jgi:hypothetical protein
MGAWIERHGRSRRKSRIDGIWDEKPPHPHPQRIGFVAADSRLCGRKNMDNPPLRTMGKVYCVQDVRQARARMLSSAGCLSGPFRKYGNTSAYGTRCQVLAGLQSTISSDPGIRKPLHPRRLRCPPSPYHRGYASAGRLAGRGASCLSSDFAPRTARDRSASELRRTIRRSLGDSVRRNSPGTFLIHLRDAGEECPRPRCAEPPLCLLARESCTEQFPYYL